MIKVEKEPEGFDLMRKLIWFTKLVWRRLGRGRIDIALAWELGEILK